MTNLLRTLVARYIPGKYGRIDGVIYRLRERVRLYVTGKDDSIRYLDAKPGAIYTLFDWSRSAWYHSSPWRIDHFIISLYDEFMWWIDLRVPR